MSERLNGIVVFVQAVEAGNFALAAERLHLTRSAVAKTIARIEERLGARLFHRTTRTQTLTDDGQVYYERCVKALAELEAGEATLHSGRSEPAGLLRLSAPVLFGRYCVAPSMARLTAVHPQLKVDMSFNDRVVDLIDEGYDLAVRVGSLPDSATLVSRRLGAQLMLVCAAPAYLGKHGRPASMEDLRGHACIAYGRNGNQLPWRLNDENGRAHDLTVDTRLRFDDIQAIADAAVAGHGLAWLPCWLVSRYLKRGELERVFDCDRVAPTEIHLVWPRTPYLPAKTRAAVDILLAEAPRRMAASLEPPANELAAAGSGGRVNT